jgi:hypothetical protein
MRRAFLLAVGLYGLLAFSVKHEAEATPVAGIVPHIGELSGDDAIEDVYYYRGHRYRYRYHGQYYRYRYYGLYFGTAIIGMATTIITNGPQISVS